MQILPSKDDGREFFFMDRLKSYLNSWFTWIIFESYFVEYSKYFEKLRSSGFGQSSISRFIKPQMDLATKVLNVFIYRFREQFKAMDKWACQALDYLEGFNKIAVKATLKLDLLKIMFRNYFKNLQFFVTVFFKLFKKVCEKIAQLLIFLLEKVIDMVLNSVRNQNEEKYSEIVGIIKQYKTQKEIANCSNNFEYFSSKNRLQILLFAFIQVIQIQVIRGIENSKVISFLIISLFKFIQVKLDLTKDKIDLYKEYIDVLCKQFMVQDGRSLDNVKSFEERTKIIIRRSIGNVLTAFHLVYNKFKLWQVYYNQKFNVIKYALFEAYFQYKAYISRNFIDFDQNKNNKNENENNECNNLIKLLEKNKSEKEL